MTNDRLGRFCRCKVTDSAGNVVYGEPGEVWKAVDHLHLRHLGQTLTVTGSMATTGQGMFAYSNDSPILFYDNSGRRMVAASTEMIGVQI